MYNFVLCTVIPRNYVLGGFEIGRTTQVELHLPTNATWFQKIYFGQENICIRKHDIYRIYMNWETSDYLKRYTAF
jgi:hypothetical protein